MRNLTVENFLNEMSYDLRMDDLEKVVTKYQDVILRYVLQYQHSYKEKKRVHDVFEVIRSEKYLATLEKMVEDTNGVLDQDMAYVVVAATDFPFVDVEVKARAMAIAYDLRESNFEHVENLQLRQMLTTLSIWSVRAFETSPIFKSMALAKIIDKFPRVAANTFENRIIKLDNKTILKIFCSVCPDIVIEDIVSAFLYSEYKYDGNTVEGAYSIKLRSFFYAMCGVINANKFVDMLDRACQSMINKNIKYGNNESFQGKYLDFGLFVKLVKDFKKMDKVDTVAQSMIKAHDTIARFIVNNSQYKDLF